MADGTVMVNLKRGWFGPGASLYEVRDNPHEFPAAWAAKPKQRKDESDEDFEARKKASKYELLPSTAEVLGEGTTVAVVQNTGSGDRLIVPTAVEDKVKSVGGALDNKGVEQPNLSVAKAEAGAKEQNLQVGGKPRESGPLPAGTKKPA